MLSDQLSHSRAAESPELLLQRLHTNGKHSELRKRFFGLSMNEHGRTSLSRPCKEAMKFEITAAHMDSMLHGTLHATDILFQGPNGLLAKHYPCTT